MSEVSTQELLKRIELLEARVIELSRHAHTRETGYNDYDGDPYDYDTTLHLSTDDPGPEGPFHIEAAGIPICDTDIKVVLGSPPNLRTRDPICGMENYYDLLEEAITLSYQSSDESLKIVKGRCPGEKHKKS